jgi:Na+-translocating ferredoxin:NAD+ oxidoreductase RnfD subunit
MNLVWERKPSWQDPRVPFLALLICYLVLGITLLGFNRSPAHILLTIAFACLLDMAFHALFKKGRLLFPLSAAITGSSLSILVNYAHGSWYPLIPVLFAIASKYLLTVDGRHVFNPSLFGVVLSLLVADGMISAAPAYQWGGSIALVFFIVTAALVLFVFKINRTALIVSFLLSYFVVLAFRAWLTRWHMPPETWFMGALTSPAFFLFAFFMITDPATSPVSRMGQIFMGVSIVVVDLLLHKIQIHSTLFYAGFAYYLARFCWLHIRQGRSLLQNGIVRLRVMLLRWGAMSLLVFTVLIALRVDAFLFRTLEGDFYFHEVEAQQAGIMARPGDLLEQVDPRLLHIGKWILSVGDAIAVNDVNEDGLPDIFLTNSLKDVRDRAALYLNQGDFRFKRVPLPGLQQLLDHPHSEGIPSGALWFDYDNDSDNDLFVMVSFGHFRVLKNLWREQGRVEFVEVSEQLGLTDYTVSVTANVLDIDRDGRLDLVIGNAMDPYLPGYDEPTRFNVFKLPEPEYADDRRMLNIMHRTWHSANNGGENYLYLNRGDSFDKQSSRTMGLYEHRWTLDIGTGDLNNDGLTDLYFSNDFGPDSLYLNAGGNRFNKISGLLVGSLGRDAYKGMNASLGDIDNNGYLDIYVSNVHEKQQAEGSLLWMNNGAVDEDGATAFRDEATVRNALNEKRFGWGAAMGDLDRDGRLDIVQANGMVDDSYDRQHETCPDFWYWNANIALTGPDVHGYADRWAELRGRCIFPYERNRVYHNRGNHFVDLAEQVGLSELGNARGVALVDLDNDGDLDMFITRQFAPVSIYRNDAKSKHWLGLQLIGNGRSCNRNAVGTRVTAIDDDGQQQLREVQASNGFSAQGDSRLLFGLNDYSGAVTLKINWCGQQPAQTVRLQTMQYHVLTQQPG